MRRLMISLLALGLCAPAAGCKNLLKKRETAESAAASAAPPPLPPVVSAPTVAPSAAVAETPPPPADDAPTPEDFEDQAFEKITAQNFEAELARVKKEVSP